MSFQLSLSTESVSAAYPDQPLFVTPTSTVGEVIQLLRAQKNGSVLVCDSDSGDMLGIFTERDALRCMSDASNEEGSKIMQQPISSEMSEVVATLKADTNMGEMIKLMSQGGYRHVPIVDAKDHPVGMETVYGIVHYLVDHFPQTIYNLPPDPGRVPSEREGA